MNKDMENTFNQMAELGGSDERLGQNTAPVINAPILPKNTRPAPAATDTGLVTVAKVDSRLGDMSRLSIIDRPLSIGTEVCLRSQADELLAAERAKTERWHKKAMDAGVIVHSDGTTSHPMRKERDDLKADNAAKDARIKELEGDLKTYQEPVIASEYEKLDLQFKVIDLEAKLAAAEKALGFYADPKNYDDTPPYDGDPECFTPKAIPMVRELDGGAYCDCGDIARAVLGGKPS